MNGRRHLYGKQTNNARTASANKWTLNTLQDPVRQRAD